MLLFVWSCSKSKEEKPKELDYVDVELPSALKSALKAAGEVQIFEKDIKVIKDDGTEVIGKMRFAIPENDDFTLVAFEMTSNIFEETNLTPDFWVTQGDEAALKSAMGIGSCLKNCKEGHEKGEGRGWCRTDCWAELAVKIATVVVAIVAL